MDLLSLLGGGSGAVIGGIQAPTLEFNSTPGAGDMTDEMVALQQALSVADQSRWMGLGDMSSGGAILRAGGGTSVSGAPAASGGWTPKSGAEALQKRDAYKAADAKGWSEAVVNGSESQQSLKDLVAAVKAIYTAVGSDQAAPVANVQAALTALKGVDAECDNIAKEGDNQRCKADVAAVKEYIGKVKKALEGAGQKFTD